MNKLLGMYYSRPQLLLYYYLCKRKMNIKDCYKCTESYILSKGMGVDLGPMEGLMEFLDEHYGSSHKKCILLPSL